MGIAERYLHSVSSNATAIAVGLVQDHLGKEKAVAHRILEEYQNNTHLQLSLQRDRADNLDEFVGAFDQRMQSSLIEATAEVDRNTLRLVTEQANIFRNVIKAKNTAWVQAEEISRATAIRTEEYNILVDRSRYHTADIANLHNDYKRWQASVPGAPDPKQQFETMAIRNIEANVDQGEIGRAQDAVSYMISQNMYSARMHEVYTASLANSRSKGVAASAAVVEKATQELVNTGAVSDTLYDAIEGITSDDFLELSNLRYQSNEEIAKYADSIGNERPVVDKFKRNTAYLALDTRRKALNDDPYVYMMQQGVTTSRANIDWNNQRTLGTEIDKQTRLHEQAVDLYAAPVPFFSSTQREELALIFDNAPVEQQLQVIRTISLNAKGKEATLAMHPDQFDVTHTYAAMQYNQPEGVETARILLHGRILMRGLQDRGDPAHTRLEEMETTINEAYTKLLRANLSGAYGYIAEGTLEVLHSAYAWEHLRGKSTTPGADTIIAASGLKTGRIDGRYDAVMTKSMNAAGFGNAVKRISKEDFRDLTLNSDKNTVIKLTDGTAVSISMKDIKAFGDWTFYSPGYYSVYINAPSFVGQLLDANGEVIIIQWDDGIIKSIINR